MGRCAKQQSKRRKENDMAKKKAKQPEPNIVVPDVGIACPHCKTRHGHKVTNTYPNGRRRRLCGGCGRPFVSAEIR